MKALTLRYGTTDYRYTRPEVYSRLNLPSCLMLNINGEHTATVFQLPKPERIEPLPRYSLTARWGYIEKFNPEARQLACLNAGMVEQALLDEHDVKTIFDEIRHRHTEYLKKLLRVPVIRWVYAHELCSAVHFDDLMYDRIATYCNGVQ